MMVRYCKVALVGAIALLMGLMALNNVTDYGTNLRYVQHVLSMDTTFPKTTLRWRAITSPLLQQLVYGGMVLTELTTSGLCAWGAYQLLRAGSGPAKAFAQAKPIAIAGLTLGLVFWIAGFLAIGGEWFAMWQSETWNAQQPAFRFIGAIGIVLLFVQAPEPEG